MPDQLEATLRRLVADEVGDFVRHAEAEGRAVPSEVDQRQMARAILQRELTRRSREALRLGEDLLDPAAEHDLIERVLASAFSVLPQLEQYLARDAVANIHINGCDDVRLELVDGTVERVPPLFGSNDELIDHVQQLARRGGDIEKEWTPSRPFLDLTLDSGARLAACAWIAKDPYVTIRRHPLVDADLEGAGRPQDVRRRHPHAARRRHPGPVEPAHRRRSRARQDDAHARVGARVRSRRTRRRPRTRGRAAPRRLSRAPQPGAVAAGAAGQHGRPRRGNAQRSRLARQTPIARPHPGRRSARRRDHPDARSHDPGCARLDVHAARRLVVERVPAPARVRPLRRPRLAHRGHLPARGAGARPDRVRRPRRRRPPRRGRDPPRRALRPLRRAADHQRLVHHRSRHGARRPQPRRAHPGASPRPARGLRLRTRPGTTRSGRGRDPRGRRRGHGRRRRAPARAQRSAPGARRRRAAAVASCTSMPSAWRWRWLLVWSSPS